MCVWGRAGGVSDFFYYESKFKIKKYVFFFWGGEGRGGGIGVGGAGVSEFPLFGPCDLDLQSAWKMFQMALLLHEGNN